MGRFEAPHFFPMFILGFIIGLIVGLLLGFRFAAFLLDKGQRTGKLILFRIRD